MVFVYSRKWYKQPVLEIIGMDKTSAKRDTIKQDGSRKLQMPRSSPYNAYFIFSKPASNLYGAGTKWCTTSWNNDDPSNSDDMEMFPNLVYFIHKTKTIQEDPRYYKLAAWWPSLYQSTVYRYDAQNLAMSLDEFIDMLGIQPYQLDNIRREVLRVSFDLSREGKNVPGIESRIPVKPDQTKKPGTPNNPATPSNSDPGYIQMSLFDDHKTAGRITNWYKTATTIKGLD